MKMRFVIPQRNGYGGVPLEDRASDNWRIPGTGGRCQCMNGRCHMLCGHQPGRVRPVVRRSIPPQQRRQLELDSAPRRTVRWVLRMHPAQLSRNLVQVGDDRKHGRKRVAKVIAYVFGEFAVPAADKDFLFVHVPTVAMHGTHEVDVIEYPLQRP